MIPMMRSGWISGLALAIAFTISFTAASPASARGREDSISGKSAQIVGLTRVKTSFGPRVTRDDYLDVLFTEDRFTALAVSGSYTQDGKKVRFQVDEERLLAFERSWEVGYEQALRDRGLDPESVDCEITKAKLKGRLRRGEIKFKSIYKIRCTAEGDFGGDHATGRIRFRGRDQLHDGIILRPPFGSVPLPELPGPGSGGSVTIVATPGGDLVLRDNTIELEPCVRCEATQVEPVRGGGSIEIINGGSIEIIGGGSFEISTGGSLEISVRP